MPLQVSMMSSLFMATLAIHEWIYKQSSPHRMRRIRSGGLHSGNVVQSASEQAAEEDVRDLWPSGPVEALSHEQLEAMLDGPRERDTLVVLYAPWCQYSQVI